MRRCLLPLALLCCFSEFVVAQELDKTKLRAAVELPAVAPSVHLRFEFDARDDSGNCWDAAKEIAKETQRLTGTVDDAKIYLKIADWHSIGDAVKEAAAIRKAQEIPQPYLNTTDPGKAYLAAWFCRALVQSGKDSWDECEKIGSRVLKIALEDWRVW